MKRARIRLAQQYEGALRKFVKLGSPTGLPLARAAGKKAAALGLRALDLARLHDRALAKFGPRVTRVGAPHRPDAFFAEAFARLEQGSSGARKTAARLK